MIKKKEVHLFPTKEEMIIQAEEDKIVNTMIRLKLITMNIRGEICLIDKVKKHPGYIKSTQQRDII